MAKKRFYLLRAGATEVEKIDKAIGEKIRMPKTKKIQSPGKSKKHYSPLARLRIVKNESETKYPSKSVYISFKNTPKKNIYTPISSLKMGI